MNQRKFLSFLMAVLFALTCAGMASAALTPNAEGVYEIGTEEGLAWFRDSVNDGSISVSSDAKLTADITLTGNWTPIGRAVMDGYDVSEDRNYVGTFDGQNHKISGLKVTSADIVPVTASWGGANEGGALFGGINYGGAVKNLTIVSPDIHVGDQYTHNYSGAGVVAHTLGGSAQNITVQGGSISGLSAGGIVSYVEESGATISDCTVNGMESMVALENAAGGIVAELYYGSVTNCTVNGIESIEGFYAGGVVGYNNAGTVANSTASGIEIISSDYSAGGVVAYNDNEGIVTNSTAIGIENITAFHPDEYSYAGGVVGYNYDGMVTNSTASGLQTIKAGDRAGGVVGDNRGLIANCMAGGVGMIEANYPGWGNVGGVVGYNDNGMIKNSLLLAGEEQTTLSGDVLEGGVLGYLNGAAANLSRVQDCLYPSNVIFVYYDDKPIGNVPLVDMDDQYNVTSYDVTEEDQSKLPAIMAMIEQGIAVEVQKGRTYTLDVTTLPGTLGFENLTFDWDTDDVSGDVIEIESVDGAKATLKGVELGTANVTCTVTGDIEAELTCAVTVIEAQSGGGGSSSNCNAFGFGLIVLAALPFLYRRKR